MRLTPFEEMVEIGPGRVAMRRADDSIREIPTDSVVLCSKGRSERGLYRALKGRVKALWAIGDCWSPRQLEQAIYEGSNVARSI